MEKISIKATKQGGNNPYLSFEKTEYIKFLKSFNDGKSLIITITDQRSLGKNACLHGWINILCDYTGHTFEEMKYWTVVTNFGYTTIMVDDVEVKVPLSTSRMNNEEFAQGLTRTHVWAMELFGVNLPSSDIDLFT